MDKCMINVRDFGARGDGKADCTQAIQTALDAAAENHGTVFVPAGRYLCGELQMHPGTGIQGLPTWSFRDNQGSVLILNDRSASCLINLTGAFGATVQGLCLDGGGHTHPGDPIHGVMVNKPDYGKQEDTPRIDGCRISNFSGDGIRLERIWCFSVRHSQCIRNAGSGLRVRGWDGFILDNWFSGNGEAGYAAIDENASITMTGNRIEWNRNCGILVHGGSHYNITGNYIDRSGRNGIALRRRDEEGCGRVFTVTGNAIYRSGKPDWGYDDEYDNAHVRLEGVKGLVFSGNTLNVGRDDGSKGEFSPNCGLVLEGLTDSIVKDTAMHDGALMELVVDRGGHTNTIVKDNIGSLFGEATD